MTVATPQAGAAQEGKYLSFALGREEYGLEILKVQEINSLKGITRVPQTPPFVRGVINLRGRVIPVVSLRRVFHLPDVDDTDDTCIIVAQVDCRGTEQTIGVVVDSVSEVVNIRADQIETAPSYGGGMEDTDVITGLGKLSDRIIVLLDLDSLLAGRELANLVAATG